MKPSSTLKWINQHGASFALAALLVGLCALFHRGAFSTTQMIGIPSPAEVNSGFERNLVLIDFINKNWDLVAYYLTLFAGSLVYMELRNNPRWAKCSCWIIFAAPCIMYLRICSRVLLLPNIGFATPDR